MKFGYNIDVNSVPHDKAIRDCIASGSPVHTIMTARSNGMAQVDDVDILWKFHNALFDIYGSELVLIWRWYTPKEGDWSELPTNQVYQTLINGFNIPPSVIIDSFSNEPSLNGNSYETNHRYAEHERKMLEMVASTGNRYAVGAFGVGFPHEEMVSRGVYDKLLLDVDKYNGVLSLHAYGVFPFEAGEMWVWDMLHKTEQNKEFIRNRYLDNQVKWEGYAEYKGWLIGRYLWLEERCDHLGIPTPDVYFTEGFVDRIDAMPNGVNDTWKRNFGMDMYNRDNRGILSWQKYLFWLFPEKTFDEVLKMAMIYLRENILHQPYIKGMTLFGYNRDWGYPSGSHKESGHNWEDDSLSDFREFDMPIVNEGEYNIPVPISVMGFLSSTDGGSNVRDSTEINNNVIFELTNEKIMVELVQDHIMTDSNSYEWMKFEYDGLVYFVAKTNRVSFESEVIDLPEEPKHVVDILGLTEVMTQTEQQDLIDVFESLVELVEGINTSYDNDLDFFTETLDAVQDLLQEITETNKEQTIKFLTVIKQAIIDAKRW